MTRATLSLIGVGNAVATFGVPLMVLDELAERGLVGCCLSLDGDQHGAVVPGAEAFGQQVVGAADGLALRLVPEVTEPEADGKQRQGEQNQQTGGAEQARPRTTLDEATPAVPEAPLLGLLGAVRHHLAQGLDGEGDGKEDDRQPEPRQVQHGRACEEADEREDDGDRDGDQRRPRRVVDPRADPAEKRGQQRQRTEDHHQHADRRSDGHARDEAEPDHGQAHQRDDHRDPGEQDGPAAGVHRLDDGFLDAEAEAEAFPEAGHDEQRVVDADAESDHGDHRRHEVGHRDHVAQEGDEREPDAEPEQRGADR